MALAVYFHERFLEHDAGAWHPEAPARLIAARSALAASDLPLVWREPRPATVEEIARVHTVAYIEGVERLADRGGGAIDMDTSVSPASYEAATLAGWTGWRLWSVHSAKERGPSFWYVRPVIMRFVGVAWASACSTMSGCGGRRAALDEFGLHRVLIFDWDVHHGNGTQDAFFGDPHVFYASSHLGNHYPGTGSVYEVGQGMGAGFTMNVPLPHGAGDGVMRYLFEALLEPVLREFEPGLILISSGFDSQRGDPLGGLRLSPDAFHWMALRLSRAAEELGAAGPVCFLEGGYEPDLLAGSIVRTMEGLAGREVNFSPEVSASDRAEVAPTMSGLRKYWSVLDEVH